MYKIFILFIFISITSKATDPYPKNPALDVIHYTFHFEVNDSTDVIAGKTFVSIKFKKPTIEFELDLAGKDKSGKGMSVSSIMADGKKLTFSHSSNRLKIKLINPAKENEIITFEVKYSGIPIDGLIIGKNKFGDRGFFGDNWPDRGHHWLPVVDHPSDKAAVDFIITAPLHYSVVANGIKIEESPVGKNQKLTHWHEEVPIPVKVMVAGIARFAVQYVGKVNDISVESWVYPQNREAGFFDYAIAVNVLDYFHNHIGEYSYKKLANVQSKTRWGGLENANTIFYFENSVTGKNEREGLIAHEEAHQWFGNSATENDWHHVWLSEGFATYFASLYLESAYGRDRLVEEQKKDRDEVIKYHLKKQAPVVDTTITDINTVLSTNTYQKGGWVLHMLRHQLGDQDFWKGIRQYFATYKNSNALTEDFLQIMEAASGKDLDLFFNQWLYVAGHPKISAKWSYDSKSKSVLMEVTQNQTDAFQFPLEVGIMDINGQTKLKTVRISSKSEKFIIPVEFAPKNISLDPDTWLLFEGSIVQK